LWRIFDLRLDNLPSCLPGRSLCVCVCVSHFITQQRTMMKSRCQKQRRS
jgi:hypothetical protein